MAEAVRVEGLRDFQRAVKRMDAEAGKQLRLAHNEAAKLVVDKALPQVPAVTGHARKTLKAASTQTASRAAGGGKRAAYYPWLDFGGKAGRNKKVERKFYKDGRYLYKSYFELRDSGVFQKELEQALLAVIHTVGLEVD